MLSAPRTAIARASWVGPTPSSSRRATSPPPRASAPRPRRREAEPATGSSIRSRALARSSTVSYGLPEVTVHSSRQNGPSAWPPSVSRASAAVASGVRACRPRVTTARSASAARTAGTPVRRGPSGRGRWARTTRAGSRRSRRIRVKASSHARDSASAQCASSTSSTGGRSRNRSASRSSSLARPSRTPCGSAGAADEEGGGARPSAGASRSKWPPQRSRTSSSSKRSSAGWRSWRVTWKGTEVRVSPPRAVRTVQRSRAVRRISRRRVVLPMPASPR